MGKKIVIIIPARLESSRFNNKVLHKISDLENSNATMYDRQQELEDKLTVMQDDIYKLEAIVDDHEQRNRNYCLLLHGIEEKENEDTDKLAMDNTRFLPE